MLGRWRREREQRIAEAKAATARSERLAVLIDMLIAEAHAVNAWAQERYEQNHLTDLFHRGRQ